MKNGRTGLLFSTAFLSLAVSAAAPRFASPFTSNAVIQRDLAAPVWGTAAPGATVTIAIDPESTHGTSNFKSGRRTVTTAADGTWRTTVGPQPAQPGQTCKLSVSDGADTTILTNIVFGDIWLCSGQSNMEMNHGWGLTNGREDIETNVFPEVRLLNVPNATGYEPARSFDAVWEPCAPAAAKNFSACGYFFGAALHRAMPGIPIGLVDVTWSGSPVETWLSTNAVASLGPDFLPRLEARRARIDTWLKAGLPAHRQRWAEWKAHPDPFGEQDPPPFAESYDDTSWASAEMPQPFTRLIDDFFVGVVWHRRTFTLTAPQAAATNATLCLGPIGHEDVTYVNGQQIGTGRGEENDRHYRLPPGLLRAGVNTIVVRAFDKASPGGFLGVSGQLRLDLGDGSVPLAGPWRYAATDKPIDFRMTPSDCFAACYNGMVCPLFPLAIKGAIWYQGESNVGDEKAYERLLRAMVADWRSHFSSGDFPFYIVQLTSFRLTHWTTPAESPWSAMRDVQLRLGETLRNSGTAVTLDVGDIGNIHPKDKKTVGERLARLALARAYGRSIVEAGPIPLSAGLTAKGVEVVFKNAAGLRPADGKQLKGFQLAGTDGKFTYVDAKAAAGTAVLAVPAGMKPVRVRYAWDGSPNANLINGEGLPAGTFEMTVRDP